jgi:hypothetical protein
VCLRQYTAFGLWHSAWFSRHVSEAQQTHVDDWFVGRTKKMLANNNKTTRLDKTDLERAPYRPFCKWRVGV